jgi:hypothetical protein
MALYPHAVQRLWNMYNPERPITPRMVILHTNAVNSEDPPSTGGLSWHFQVGEQGVVYQHRDTQTEAAANADANQFAISIETWDGGNPETTPWNDLQLDAIVKLISWCCDTHSIPREIVVVWNGSGLGYHRMFPQWDQPYHSCPGDLRAGQFSSIIMPRLQTPENPFMALTDQQQAELYHSVIAMHKTNWIDTAGYGDLAWLAKQIDDGVARNLDKIASAVAAKIKP